MVGFKGLNETAKIWLRCIVPIVFNRIHIFFSVFSLFFIGVPSLHLRGNGYSETLPQIIIVCD